MRLTKKVNKGMNGTPIYVGLYGNIVCVGNNQATSMVHSKLGQLEDIEEELGIDLVTLFKAMKNGVFVISYDEGIVFEEPMLSFNQEVSSDLYVLDGVYHMPPDKLCKSINYYLKDYGKTWALTKEELL